jgi:acetate kinase
MPTRDAGAILVVNAGSSSIKFAVHETRAGDKLRLDCRGRIEGVGGHPHLIMTGAGGRVVDERRWPAGASVTVHDLVEALLERVEKRIGAGSLLAAGHRVALGGLEHDRPLLLDRDTLERLRRLIPLAPLHLPANLEPIESLWKLDPGLAQVACFDTAFHRTMPRVAGTYGLPRALTESGARRYGFHGLSYEYIAGELPQLDAKAAKGRAIVAHLGSGASLCALREGRSVATTMGFSPLSGIMMATRPGDLDPGLVLWLLRERGMSPAELETVFYRESGLLGVSGISNDMRVLLDSDDPHAKEAVELFVYRVCREIGSLAAALGGLDAIVFTAGIGEHAPAVRKAVAEGCAWLGVAMDDIANANARPRISRSDSRVNLWVVPTDEELMIARHTTALVSARQRARSA